MKNVAYRVALLAPFLPLQGGMSQLATMIADCLENDGHTVLRINFGISRSEIWRLPVIYLRIFFATLRSDIAHIVSASGLSLWSKDLPALLVARLCGKKTVLHFVGGSAVEQAHSWPWWKRLPFRLAHRVVVPTKIFRDALIKNGLIGEYTVIPHVVDVESFFIDNNGNAPPILLAAKNLVPYAGYDRLLDIFDHVRNRIPDAELWIAGDGPMRSKLEARTHKNGGTNVTFLGAVSHQEIPELMAKASLLVHCTKYESFGISLVEAMAAGLPVVAFAVGGIPEVVIDSETGYLAPYDEKGVFFEKVTTLLEDKVKRKQMSEKARQHSLRFSWDHIGKLWHRLYSSLLELDK